MTLSIAKQKNSSDHFLSENKIEGSTPYTQLFKECLLRAKTQGASDIHVLPGQNKISIRFRLSGDLSTWKEIESTHAKGFLNEIKALCNLSISQSGVTQDARVSLPSWRLNLRVSLIPSQYGEKIVLRLLDLDKVFDLEKGGLALDAINCLKESLNLDNGIILISGPTGSGKTTTLYSCLNYLDRNILNVTTLEDPIEYTFEGLTQVEITPKLSFSDALRAVLRQDPDVILVGEIRDQETAELANRAAQTGHLVLSTVHANGSIDVITRLEGLGIDRYHLSQSLRFSSAQRLLRLLCESCKIPLNDTDLAKISKNLNEEQKPDHFFKRSEIGCEHCNLTPPGRVPILEYVCGSELQEILNLDHKEKPILKNSLKSQILKLANQGVIDANEILTVA